MNTQDKNGQSENGMTPEQRFAAHFGLAVHIAEGIAAEVSFNSLLKIDDLASLAQIGLWTAAGRFDPTRKNDFMSFARFRVRGAVIDGLREIDWVPRTTRERLEKVEEERAFLYQQLGREATKAEWEQAYKRSSRQVREIEYDQVAAREPPLSLQSTPPGLEEDGLTYEDIIADEYAADPFEVFASKEEAAARQEKIRVIWQVIGTLPDRLQTLFRLHYIDGLTFSEIAAEMSLSESMIFVLRRAGMNLILTRLKDALLASKR